jgi:hypothetical protein
MEDEVFKLRQMVRDRDAAIRQMQKLIEFIYSQTQSKPPNKDEASTLDSRQCHGLRF